MTRLIKAVNRRLAPLVLAFATLAGVAPAFSQDAPEVRQEARQERVVESKVNINKADAATIAAVLTGIGTSKAEAIVAYREMHGAFTSIEELREVKGIGMATLDRNRERISLE